MIANIESLSICEPFYVMKVLEKAKELERKGYDVIHLEVGEPDLRVPSKIVKKAKFFLEKFESKYTESTGIYELKEKLAEFYEKNYNVKIDPKRIIITPGSSIALLVAIKIANTYFGEISYSDPGYPCYKNILSFLNLKGIPIKVEMENNFKLHPEDIKSPVIIINSPSNPTGTVYKREDLVEISKKAFIISDEIYHGITYSDRAVSAIEVTEKCIVINGFSKFFLMTGWRLGWMIVPEELIYEVTKILQNVTICPPALSQYAALVCFDDDVLEELKNNIEIYRERMKVLINGLNEMNFKAKEPEGAFYIYADASKHTDNSLNFVFELLEKAHIAITPGIDFGENKTNKFVRFSFCTEKVKIEEALNRLYKYLYG